MSWLKTMAVYHCGALRKTSIYEPVTCMAPRSFLHLQLVIDYTASKSE